MIIFAAFLLSVSVYHHNATTEYVVPVVPYICYDFCA